MIKRILLFTFTIISVCNFSLRAEESYFEGGSWPADRVKESKRYYSFGAGFPSLISFNIGQRTQNNHYGVDFGIGTTPLIIAGEVHLYTNFLYYPKPCSTSQIYYGLGTHVGYAAVIGDWNRGIGLLKPCFIFGKEYMKSSTEKRFIQAELGPAYITTKGTEFLPSLTVTYGIFF